eukprot:scaffold6985_cov139-Skeletonema_menzelii.AAC.6
MHGSSESPPSAANVIVEEEGERRKRRQILVAVRQKFSFDFSLGLFTLLPAPRAPSALRRSPPLAPRS